jgi:virulence factor Mce-like protein
MSGPSTAAVRRLGAVLALVAVVAVVWWSLPGSDQHTLVLRTADATGVIPGMDVKAAGRDIGTVGEADVVGGRTARLELKIDDAAWPLPRSTRFQLRFGGTIKYTDRFLDVRPGTPATPAFADGDAIPMRSYVAPVEFDQLFGTFDAPTRRNLRSTLDAGGAALGPAQDALRSTLAVAPPALRQVRGLFDDLTEDQHALDTLVRSTASVSGAVDQATPGLGTLVDGASTTFAAIAHQSDALRRALADMPGVLGTARTTLAQADRTLTGATGLARQLDPGVGDVRRIGAPLARVLDTVQEVGPDARRALATTRRAAPDLVTLLSRAQDVLPAVGAVSSEGARQLDCIRPYTPEIAGFLSTWGPGGWGTGDTRDKYLRAEVGTYPFGNVNVLSTGQVAKVFTGLKMAFPQPPGILVGQPWFQPQCGITADALDPDKDPESQATELYPKQFLDRDWADPEAKP